MAYDKHNQRLYTYTNAQTGEKVGISLDEICECLRYNKLTQDGYRDLGMTIQNANIKADALFRPYPISSEIINFEEFKVGGPDGLYGFVVPMTTNNTVRDLWRKTWSAKGKPTIYFYDMFDGYTHLASYDEFPFGMKFTKAGSNWSVHLVGNTQYEGSVNPSQMQKFKTFYPALQVFEEDTAATGPKTTAIYSWCSSKPVGEQWAGDLISDLVIDSTKTYYVIPFLSQYKFTSKAGDFGTLNGEKYCLIYKDFNENEWKIGKNTTETLYDVLTWGEFTKDSNYACTIRYSLASKEKTFNCYVYGGYRLYTKVNGVETVSIDKWETYDYKKPTSGYYTVKPNAAAITDYITFDFGPSGFPANANRIEIRLFDPTNNFVQWTKSFDL